jgi:hypothetical protein
VCVTSISRGLSAQRDATNRNCVSIESWRCARVRSPRSGTCRHRLRACRRIKCKDRPGRWRTECGNGQGARVRSRAAHRARGAAALRSLLAWRSGRTDIARRPSGARNRVHHHERRKQHRDRGEKREQDIAVARQHLLQHARGSCCAWRGHGRRLWRRAATLAFVTDHRSAARSGRAISQNVIAAMVVQTAKTGSSSIENEVWPPASNPCSRMSKSMNGGSKT